jgi:hypothetical protein
MTPATASFTRPIGPPLGFRPRLGLPVAVSSTPPLPQRAAPLEGSPRRRLIRCRGESSIQTAHTRRRVVTEEEAARATMSRRRRCKAGRIDSPPSRRRYCGRSWAPLATGSKPHAGKPHALFRHQPSGEYRVAETFRHMSPPADVEPHHAMHLLDMGGKLAASTSKDDKTG